MTNFEVPTDLTALSVEDIHGLIETARAEFKTLNETDDLSDETLDSMTELADAIDALHSETTNRVTSKRNGIFSKVFRLTDGAAAFKKKTALAARVLPKVELKADTVTFNLANLESALDHVEDAIDDLEDEDGPQIGSAIGEARAAKTALKKAIGNYDDGPDTYKAPRRSGGGGGGGGVGVYSTDTVEFNLAKTKSALENVNDAIDALEDDNVGSALSNLRTASDQLDNAIDDYDNGGGYDYDDSIIVSTPPPDGMSTADIIKLATIGLRNSLAADGTDLKADTEEFASCSSARKRVRKARSSLRRALRALAKCSGYRVVVTPAPEPAPPPPPAP